MIETILIGKLVSEPEFLILASDTSSFQSINFAKHIVFKILPVFQRTHMSLECSGRSK